MAFSVRILADSISPTSDRLTTVLATYPRKVHSENMTHRALSKCSASSRAIPGEKMLRDIEADPVIPIWWGANQPGMQAHAEVEDKAGAEAWWREGVAQSVAHARKGMALGLHKQIVNRVVEPGMWITVVMSGTTWTNFEGLRCHPDAEPHMRRMAELTMETIYRSTPQILAAGQWHLPFIYPEDRELATKWVVEGYDIVERPDDVLIDREVEEILCKVSVGRCARVSYLTHDGKRDMAEDIKLHDKLIAQVPLHATPAEHVAMAMNYPDWYRDKHSHMSSRAMNEIRMEHRKRREAAPYLPMSQMELEIEACLAQIQSGNFRGFKQYRKMKMNEHIGEPMP